MTKTDIDMARSEDGLEFDLGQTLEMEMPISLNAMDSLHNGSLSDFRWNRIRLGGGFGVRWRDLGKKQLHYENPGFFLNV